MRQRVSDRCTVSRKDTSKSLSLPSDVRCLLSTQITWVILFTNSRRYFVVVVFDADIAAASQRGVHMLVVLVRGHKVQQPLQQRAHPLCGAQILHQAVLVHLVGVVCLQIDKQEPKRALAHILKQFFDLLASKTAADLFQYGLAL